MCVYADEGLEDKGKRESLLKEMGRGVMIVVVRHYCSVDDVQFL